MALSILACSAAEPAKPPTPQQRAAQRRAQATATPSVKLGPVYQIEVSPGIMVTIKSTNTFSSQDAARILRQAAIKIQTGK